MKEPSTLDLQKEDKVTSQQCLNCGTDLQGVYCHKCGQQVSGRIPKVWEFVFEYIVNAYIWDPKCLSTIWHLVRRPGFLTNEFNAGKFVAHEHPLKLNMFFLFMFVTLFLLFSDVDKVSNSFDDFRKSEYLNPVFSLSVLTEDENYMAKMMASEKDTVQLAMPAALPETCPEAIQKVRALTHNGEGRLDTMVAVVPRVLIEDKVIVDSDSGVYSFAVDNEIVEEVSNIWHVISQLWRKMVDFLLQYFPLIILLTSPFLAVAVKLLHFKRKKPLISFYIFALHFMAFIELMLLVIYVLFLTIEPSFVFLEWFFNLASCIYLTIAIKKVYENNSWFKSITKAFLIGLVYYGICFIALLVIFFAAIISVVIAME